MAQIFISHSRRDESIRAFFDSVFAGSKVRAVRLEFEQFDTTPSAYIMNQIFLSDALFVLLGPNVEFSRYTENWIGFEIGYAATSIKDIWVFEPFGSAIQFPVPLLHHYLLYELEDTKHSQYISDIVRAYETIPLFRRLPQGYMDVICPYDTCRSSFRFHSIVDRFNCPTCRQPIVFQYRT